MVETAAVSYPAAVYGKRRPFKEGLVREYEVVAHSADFPPEALRAFEAVARSFRWAPGSGRAGGVLPPCYALWPLESGGVLAVRFRDDGRDDQGRPHLLRAEAAFLPGDAAHPDTLAGLLTPAGWPDGLVLDGESSRPAFPAAASGDEEARQVLRRALARDSRPPRLLVGHPGDHRFDPPEGPALVRVVPADSGSRQAGVTAPRTRPEGPGGPLPVIPPARPSWLPRAATLAALTLAALAGWGWWGASGGRARLEDQARAAAEAEAAARREAEAVRQEAAAFKAQAEQRIGRLTADLAGRDKTLRQWQEQYQEAQRARQVYEEELKRQGKSQDAARLRVQLERSETERYRLRSALDEVTRILGTFERGVNEWRRKNPPLVPESPAP